MLFALVSLALAGSAPVPRILVVTREPVPPAIAETAFSMTCPSGLRVEIRGFGFARPRGARPVIVVNGRRATGALAARMALDLADATAAYRLSPRCDQGGRQVSLIINVGRRLESGEVTYANGAASITRRGIQSYQPTAPANADSFWYR
jgi:hypothetical protein